MSWFCGTYSGIGIAIVKAALRTRAKWVSSRIEPKRRVRSLKLRIASLTILCLALAAIPAWADYNNGPINGTTDAWTINFGYIVSDSYVSDGNATGFMFGTWEFPGDSMLT